jgi:malate dehydrogenase (oxaloacetate-decarboxylating)
MGTDNLKLLNDSMYLGERHARVRDQRYDELIDAYVTACSRLFPNAMLHWEDFGAGNARRILNKYADQVCTFNDDMQGTAAVVLAAVFSAVRAAGSRLADQTIAIHGAGTAGLGIADMLRDQMIRDGLSPGEATRRFYPLAKQGLLVSDDPSLLDFQVPYARSRDEVADWPSGPGGKGAVGGIDLATVVSKAKPTILIGTSTQPGAFSESIVREMASFNERPIILPLSNPTSKAEALPGDLIEWTDGKVLTATGSPFEPVVYKGVTYQIAQSNNALVFPGLGLGVAVTRASRISDGMIAAAADAVAALSDARTPGASLLPPMTVLRTASAAVAIAVAKAADAEGLARVELSNPIQQVYDAMWQPEYPRIETVDS